MNNSPKRKTHPVQSMVIHLMALWALSCLPALGQTTEGPSYFPKEDFLPIRTTLPDSQLNFQDDSQDSCCAGDAATPSVSRTEDRSPANSNEGGTNLMAVQAGPSMAKSAFEKSNPRYSSNSTPAHLISCEAFLDMPEQVANTSEAVPDFNNRRNRNNLPITSYSTNISARPGADYFTDSNLRNTSDFHIETSGGASTIRLEDVQSYSVCMARGNNVAMVANTDNGSILTYNGNDHVYLAGNNTNMLTRTGAGNDIIELYLTRSAGNATMPDNNTSVTAFNIYKTALSGGSDTDTLNIRNTPFGTKWCHIGGYRIYGEYFYVVEFALPPTVQSGPRRQRISIGQSVEFVTIKGKRYHLSDFLAHGDPVDDIARSVPIGDALPIAR